MGHKVVLNLMFAVHPLTRMGDIDPSYTISGKALKTIAGNTEEECLEEVKKFIKNHGFLLVKETKNVNESNRHTRIDT